MTGSTAFDDIGPSAPSSGKLRRDALDVIEFARSAIRCADNRDTAGALEWLGRAAKAAARNESPHE